MPNVHIWVRKEDWDTWQAIADKPKWLHAKLSEPKPVANRTDIQNLNYIPPRYEPMEPSA